MAGDLNFTDAVVNTFEIVIIVVPLQLLLALAMAMMLRHRARRARHRAVDLVDPARHLRSRGGPGVAGDPDRPGLPEYGSSGLGILTGPQSWLTYETPMTLLVAIVVAEIWRATAIVLVILVAGVQLVPKEYDEAAEVFGATPWQRFIRVTLPLLARHPDRADPAHGAGVRDVRDGDVARRAEFPGAGERGVQLAIRPAGLRRRRGLCGGGHGGLARGDADLSAGAAHPGGTVDDAARACFVTGIVVLCAGRWCRST